MVLLPLQPSLHASQLSLEKLAQHPDLSDAAKISELACQFEAMLLRQILEQARKPVIKSEFARDSASDDIYRDLITSQLADSISRSGTFGLAHNLEQELTQQLRRPPSPQPTP